MNHFALYYLDECSISSGLKVFFSNPTYILQGRRYNSPKGVSSLPLSGGCGKLLTESANLR
jgi:hypothetical protein